MSEKRFSVRLRRECDGVVYSFFDGDKPLDVDMIVALLNEQQATIEEQNKQIEEWDFSFRTEMAHHRVAEKELQDKIREQQATIEILTKRRDRWRELSNSFSAYCNCYEKAIERAFEEKPYPSEEDINRIYAELEKELEYE